MISTGAFQTEMDASKKQNELVKKLVGAWEQKNSKAARAGGVSLMALTLAACGSDDDTPFSQVDVDAAKVTATTAALTGSDGTAHASVDAAVTSNDASVTAAATTAALTGSDGTVHASVDAAVTSNDTAIAAAVDTTTDDAAATSAAISTASGGAFTDAAALFSAYNALANPTAVSAALTANQDVLNGTSANDAFTATGATLGGTDVITDGSSTDSDSLTVTLGEATNGTTPTSVSGIETVTYNVTSLAAVSIDVANVVGAAITVNNTGVGASTNANIDNLSSTSSVTMGTGITGTADVLLAEGSAATVNAGSASQLDVADAGSEGASIVAGDATNTIEVEGDGDTTTAGVANDAISISGAGEIALDTNDAAGGGTDQVENLTLSGNGAAVDFTINAGDAPESIAITGDQNVTIAIAANDIATETVTNTSTGVARLEINADDTVDLSNVAASVIIDITDSTTGGDTYTIANNGNAAVSATGTMGFDSTELTTGSETINLAITIDGVGSAITVTDFETINVSTELPPGATPLGADSRLDAEIVGGATSVMNLTGAQALELDTASVADTLNAASYTGAITMTTTAANINNLTFGSGNDTITVATAETVTIVGGDGVDTLVAGADMDTTTFSGFEVLDATANITNIDSGQLATAMSIVDGTVTIDNANTATIDMSVHSVNAAVTFTVTGALDGTVFSSTQALNITGNANNDSLTGTANADTISGGAGVDTIRGAAGADTYTGGTGADNFVLSGGADTITDYAALSDNVQFDHSDLTTAAAVFAATTIDLVELDDASDIAGAEAAVIQEIEDQAGGAAEAATANSNLFILLGETYANNAAMVDGIETGDHEITTHADVAVDDGFLVVWSDGTNAYVSMVNVDNGGTADFAAGELAGTTLANLGANASIVTGEFVNGDFAFIG